MLQICRQAHTLLRTGTVISVAVVVKVLTIQGGNSKMKAHYRLQDNSLVYQRGIVQEEVAVYRWI